jgi:glycosyltransferase involved in cell wall biosynthesis
LVDDGCPECSYTAGLDAAGYDPRVKVIHQENSGPGAARNAGIAAAHGELIAFLDADDAWSPDCLAEHFRAFKADPGLGISFGRVRFCDTGLRWAGRQSTVPKNFRLVDALGDNLTCTTSNLVVRHNVFRDVGGFDTALRHAEDQDFVVRVVATSPWHVRGIDLPLVYYRTSEGGLSADLTQMRAGWNAMLERARAIAPGPVGSVERRARARFYRYLARRALRIGQPAGTALQLFLEAICASPMTLLRHHPRRTVQTALGVAAALLIPDRLIRPLIAY